MFRKLVNWLNLVDLDEALRRASMRIVARYARGNTSIQDGRSMNRKRLSTLSLAADAAMYRLRQSLSN